jgi:hypothetical protein
MKLMLLPAALLLLANSAAAEGPGMQEKLQKILSNRSAELERSFEARLDRVIENGNRDFPIILDGQSREPIRADFNLGDLPLYFAWHSAR